MKEIFDNYVETSFDGIQQATFKFKQFEMNYGKYFPVNKNTPILDIGIGRGEMLSCMRDWGFNYQGVDISPSTVKFCNNLKLNCELTDDTASWLGRNKEKFSLITCLDVLEHVPRDQTIDFLKAVRASLANGGLTIIQVPNLQSPYGYLHHFNDFTHVTGFVEHSLGQVLLTAGFTKFEFYGFEEIYATSFKQCVRLMLRFFYRKIVRLMRAINANPNPLVLDPVMFVVAKK
jgi:2-polyprenyl-3-methyl-5-hydroxy-6-metoxy-1,4-benzoquinol methylase